MIPLVVARGRVTDFFVVHRQPDSYLGVPLVEYQCLRERPAAERIGFATRNSRTLLASVRFPVIALRTGGPHHAPMFHIPCELYGCETSVQVCEEQASIVVLCQDEHAALLYRLRHL